MKTKQSITDIDIELDLFDINEWDFSKPFDDNSEYQSWVDDIDLFDIGIVNTVHKLPMVLYRVCFCTVLVLSGLITPLTMAAYMSSNPARILGRQDLGDISVGKVADITIFDPTIEYEIHAADFVGKSKNMPYENRKVQGKVVKTIFGGNVVYDSEAN